ncbi:hypothetical protein E4U24_002300 [Claviceps purpurea]|nr:hypothetical protein E4U38_007441 [Claviceps purpurea]KAG6173034.1 hypothetical protein E4U51_006459 [Claviceps purpurea]KAG6226600.1 hypothetical protein E4U34_006789 [Claviceps purpurea]KAG6258363.1 hypothetical protein E4U24_002300 [Claviceps purpurea]
MSQAQEPTSEPPLESAELVESAEMPVEDVWDAATPEERLNMAIRHINLNTNSQINSHTNAASESSDEGVRMSPAAARRFARRTFRRTTATPDLVTSLVRPPSPEAYYIAPNAHSRLRHGNPSQPTTVTSLAQSYGRRHSTAAPDRRTGPLLPPHQSSLDIPSLWGGDCIFNMYELIYVSEPDANLLCPICHDPLVDPVTTPCDHTFCYRCLRSCIACSPSGLGCPIDRELLVWAECFSAARLIRTQLNCLMVKCPNQGRGCEVEVRREDVERHATVECRFKDFSCPRSGCDKKLRRRPRDNECRHVTIHCDLCDDEIEEADGEAHLLSCGQSKTRCEACWKLVYRSTMDFHISVCDAVEADCPFKDVGCPVRMMRGEIGCHSATCSFHPETPSGVVIRNQRDIIQTYTELGSQMRALQLCQEETSKRIDDMVATQRVTVDGGSRLNESVLSDNRTMQDLDAGFEEIHQNLTHLEARQSMWTLNQVMPIREEVTELRNNINMIRMHVNWLMNRSREEGRIRAANTTGPAAGVRRDSSADAPPMPPERRRSSSAEIDVPRL